MVTRSTDWVQLWETGVKRTDVEWEVRREVHAGTAAEQDASAQGGREEAETPGSPEPMRICSWVRGLCSPMGKGYWRRRQCLRKSWYLTLPSLDRAKRIYPSTCLSRVDVYCNTVLVSTVLGNQQMPFNSWHWLGPKLCRNSSIPWHYIYIFFVPHSPPFTLSVWRLPMPPWRKQEKNGHWLISPSLCSKYDNFFRDW